jgi:hypothetical protein
MCDADEVEHGVWGEHWWCEAIGAGCSAREDSAEKARGEDPCKRMHGREAAAA